MKINKKTLKLLSFCTLISSLTFNNAILYADEFKRIIDDSKNNNPCLQISQNNDSKKESDSDAMGMDSDARNNIIKLASEDFKDAKYSQSNRWSYGKSADCSSFVAMIYEKALGIDRDLLGGYTVAQEKSVKKIDKSDAKAGDLIFWGNDGGTHHVAIYDGKGGCYEMKDPTYNFSHTKKVYDMGKDKAWYATLKKEGKYEKYYKKLNEGKKEEDSEDNKEEDTESSKDNDLSFGSVSKEFVSLGSKSIRKDTLYTTYKYLSESGLGYKQIAGILGNWTVESSGQYYIAEGDVSLRTKKEGMELAKSRTGTSGGIGLGQWTGPRNIALRKEGEKNKKGWYTLETQLPYLFTEMNGAYQYVFKKLGDIDTPSESAVYYHDEWERSADASMALRMNMADKIAEYFEKHGMKASVNKNKLKNLKGRPVSGGVFDATSSEGSSSMNSMCGIEEENSSDEEDFDFGGDWASQPFKGSKVPISSGFGHRNLAGSPWHDGLDYGFASLGSGRDITAVHSGKVEFAGNPSKYGLPTGLPFGLGSYVIVISTGKYQIIYQEFAMNDSKSKVKTGDVVKKGQVIYENARQAPPVDHLHLSIIKGTKKDWVKAQADWQNPNSKYFIDPAKLLGKSNTGK